VSKNTKLSAWAVWWCPSIACMAANAALTRIWPIVESSTVFLSGCPPCGRARFQRDREDVVGSTHSEVELHHREAGLRRREFPAAPRPERRGRSGPSWHCRAVTACRFDTLPLTGCPLAVVDRSDQQATSLTLSPFHTRYRGTPPSVPGACVFPRTRPSPPKKGEHHSHGGHGSNAWRVRRGEGGVRSGDYRSKRYIGSSCTFLCFPSLSA
jgi:hypothetical protein